MRVKSQVGSPRHRANLLFCCKLRQNLLAATTYDHDPQIPADLLDPSASSVLRVSETAQNLLGLAVDMLEGSTRQDLEVGNEAPDSLDGLTGSFRDVHHVDELLHEGVSGVDGPAHGGDFGADYLVLD